MTLFELASYCFQLLKKAEEIINKFALLYFNLLYVWIKSKGMIRPDMDCIKQITVHFYKRKRKKRK